eukprot:GILI01025317.1.p2 GENE.GILI01025317.1~~GILI01025317.1.p2  ORF type:complete len:101 (-),score=26.06 GILI01025317.1:228-530(-)
MSFELFVTCSAPFAKVVDCAEVGLKNKESDCLANCGTERAEMKECAGKFVSQVLTVTRVCRREYDLFHRCLAKNPENEDACDRQRAALRECTTAIFPLKN